MRNKESQTALHLAALHNRAGACQAIAHAAPGCVGAAAKHSRSAAELARRRGYNSLYMALRNARKQAESADWEPALAAERAMYGGNSEEGGGGGGRGQCLLIAPEECELHRTAPEPMIRGVAEPPPENVNRLRVLTPPGGCRA